MASGIRLGRWRILRSPWEILASPGRIQHAPSGLLQAQPVRLLGLARFLFCQGGSSAAQAKPRRSQARPPRPQADPPGLVRISPAEEESPPGQEEEPSRRKEETAPSWEDPPRAIARPPGVRRIFEAARRNLLLAGRRSLGTDRFLHQGRRALRGARRFFLAPARAPVRHTRITQTALDKARHVAVSCPRS